MRAHVERPVATEVQQDGRIRYWAYIAEAQHYLRVVTESDGLLLNAFFRSHVRAKESEIKYFYDRESDSLYLSLAERTKYRDSVEAAPGVVLDFDDRGALIGIDFERASKTIDVTDLDLHEEPAGADVAAALLDGSKLRRERERLGLSQIELARRLSVSANTIARWERGELKIEHPGMVRLALAALRPSEGRRPAVSRAHPIPAHSRAKKK